MSGMLAIVCVTGSAGVRNWPNGAILAGGTAARAGAAATGGIDVDGGATAGAACLAKGAAASVRVTAGATGAVGAVGAAGAVSAPGETAVPSFVSSAPKRDAPLGAADLAATTTGGMSRRCDRVNSGALARVTEAASFGTSS